MLLCVGVVCARTFLYVMAIEHCPRFILGMTKAPTNPSPHLILGKILIKAGHDSPLPRNSL